MVLAVRGQDASSALAVRERNRVWPASEVPLAAVQYAAEQTVLTTAPWYSKMSGSLPVKAWKV